MGKKILGRTESPLEVLQAFETVANDKQDSLNQWMLRWQSMDAPKGSPAVAMRSTSSDLMKKLEAGRFERRKDKNYIEENINHLADSERAYLNHLKYLRESGELAVPALLSALQDPARAPLHDAVRRALVDLGRPILSPLLAATEMKDETTLITVIGVLQQIGYDTSVPYLTRLSQDSGRSSTVRAAATNALKAMGAPTQNVDVADLFYKLAERFYYGNASLPVDLSTPTTWIWSWDTTSNSLTAKVIPSAIFNDRMAMREARYALDLGTGRGDALSLWLAADNKREVDLAEGQDTSGPKLPANYYNVTAGTNTPMPFSPDRLATTIPLLPSRPSSLSSRLSAPAVSQKVEIRSLMRWPTLTGSSASRRRSPWQERCRTRNLPVRNRLFRFSPRPSPRPAHPMC